jgi:hypothetical protein
VTEADGLIKRTGYIWDHYALTHLYALDEKQAMAKNSVFSQFLVKEFFQRDVTSPFLNRQFSGTGFPARQFLGPYIPEQSERHHYFRLERTIDVGLRD